MPKMVNTKQYPLNLCKNETLIKLLSYVPSINWYIMIFDN